MTYENQLYYFAGFFDGEGCVQISKNGSLQLRIVNTNLKILENIRDIFGGTVGNRTQIVNKKQYTWSAYGDTAAVLADKLSSICQEKGEQLTIALLWLKERELYKNGIRVEGKRGKFHNPERSIKIKEYQKKLSNLMKGINE